MVTDKFQEQVLSSITLLLNFCYVKPENHKHSYLIWAIGLSSCFQGVLEREQWHEMGNTALKINDKEYLCVNGAQL